MEKKYTNGEITVVWKPGRCIHSTICFSNLPDVFKPAERPWVKINGSGTDKIIETVDKCPSKALSYYRNSEMEKNDPITRNEGHFKVQIIENGPYLVRSKTILIKSDGTEVERDGNFGLCRCGGSKNKPFCDGEHLTNGFKG